MRGGRRQDADQPGWRAAFAPVDVSRRRFLGLVSGAVAVGLLEGRGRAAPAAPGGLQEARDPSAPSAFEQLHLPIVTVPSFTRNGAHVPIVVEMAHPMDGDHAIKSVHILNDSDPIPSKGTFHFTPDNGHVYLATQARMHSGTSSVVVVAECTRHGQWAHRQQITIPEGAEGCVSVADGKDQGDEDIRPPVIRIPALVARGSVRQGEVIQVQLQVKHPSRTGLALRDGQFVQVSEPFYLKQMEVFYGERPVSRYEMTPALSDNPFLTFMLRTNAERYLRIALTNSRGQRFEATEELVFS